MNQSTPTAGNEPPLVGTGAEFLIPQLTSTKFLHKAKFNGEVIDVVPNKYISVKYTNGLEENFDLVPRLSSTKMAQLILIEMNSLKVGDKFKKNEIIASSKSFKDNMYASGKNTVMAILNYKGKSHEDAYVVSENFSNTMKRDIIKEVYIIIPPDTKVLKIEKEIGKKVSQYDSLVEFQFVGDFNQYIEMNNLEVLEDSEIGDEAEFNNIINENNINRLMGIDGTISDIKILINNKNSIDKQVISFYNKLVTDTKNIINKLELNKKTKEEKHKVLDNLDLRFFKTGNHKIKNVAFTGAAIKYYIKQERSLDFGDKLAARYGTKGVISTIIPDELTPYTKSFPKIDAFISTISVFGRKNIAFVKELYLGKILYFLNVRIKEMITKQVSPDKIIKLIDDIYKLVSPKEIYEKIKNKLDNTPTNVFINQIIKDGYTFRVFIPPFSKVIFEDIKTAADLLNIQLDEKVYLPEYKTWTKKAVPVGITYMTVLEQMSDVYSNVRSIGKYQSTGQASRGKSNEGGQSISALDINAFISLNADLLLKELFTLRSDDHKTKRQVINQIINEGKGNLPTTSNVSGSMSLFKTYMTSLGIDVNWN
jgi:DNA-directed RNA polymerase beta subunit